VAPSEQITELMKLRYFVAIKSGRIQTELPYPVLNGNNITILNIVDNIVTMSIDVPLITQLNQDLYYLIIELNGSQLLAVGTN
jgi:hypothetical protein